MTKNIVILCLLMIIIGTNASNLEILHNNTRELLEKCFSDHLNPAVTTIDLIDIMFDISINEVVNSSTVTIDKNFKSSILKWHYPNHPTYLLSAEPDNKLPTVLHEIESTEIWNVASLVFVVGENCGDAEKVLRMTWGIGALTSFYVCHQKNDTLVYSFNPYSSRAPKPWSQVSIETKTDDNRWSLFSQKFTNDSKCQSFQFDKHQHLDGAPVKGMTYIPIPNTSIHEFIPEVFIAHGRNTYYIFDNIFSMINVTPVMHYFYPHSGNIDINGIEQSFRNGSTDLWVDVEKQITYDRDMFDAISLYLEGGFTLITNKFSSIPIIDQMVDTMFNFYNLALSVIILATLSIIIFINNQYNFTGTILDMFLLVLNMELMTPLERVFMRVAFFSVSLFLLMSNPALEGQLMSLLTMPSYSNVETLEDLRRNEYNVYYDDWLNQNIIRTKLWSRNSARKYLHGEWRDFATSCNNIALLNTTTACIFDFENLLFELEPDLYLAKNLLFKSFDVFVTRKHWALKKKLDEAAIRLIEAGFIDYKEQSTWVSRMIKKKIRIERLKAAEGFFEQLGFENLENVYFSMIIFYIWAFFIFIVEILSKKIAEYSDKQSRKRKLRRLRLRKMAAFIDKRIRNDFEEV